MASAFTQFTKPKLNKYYYCFSRLHSDNCRLLASATRACLFEKKRIEKNFFSDAFSSFSNIWEVGQLIKVKVPENYFRYNCILFIYVHRYLLSSTVTYVNLRNQFYTDLNQHAPRLIPLYRQKASQPGKTGEALWVILGTYDFQVCLRLTLITFCAEVLLGFNTAI